MSCLWGKSYGGFSNSFITVLIETRLQAKQVPRLLNGPLRFQALWEERLEAKHLPVLGTGQT